MGDDLCEIPEESPVSSNSLSPTKQCHQSLLCSNKGSIKSEEFDGFMHALKDQFTKRYHSSTKVEKLVCERKEESITKSIWRPCQSKKSEPLRNIKTHTVSNYSKSNVKSQPIQERRMKAFSPFKLELKKMVHEKSELTPIIEPLITMNDIDPEDKLN
ncbi:unnamed protein product [Moneuplotes crassus]|uniref:Uncharacterized protein n=1 Tax=Euplotes crassus TaxID=5936 RepID=A0AAD1Y9X9_EUPCR|nr:unnamed protein product [Moneuplotes crassus]